MLGRPDNGLKDRREWQKWKEQPQINQTSSARRRRARVPELARAGKLLMRSD